MTFWTDEKTEDLKRRHVAGESGPQIGRALGCSPAAANHKRFRLGLSRPKDDQDMLKSRATQGRVTAKTFNFGNISGRPSAGPSQPSPRDLDEPCRTDGLRIMDKGFGGCRWPIGGDGADTRFCCRPAQTSYCAPHQIKSRSRTPTPAQVTDLVRLSRRVA